MGKQPPWAGSLARPLTDALSLLPHLPALAQWTPMGAAGGHALPRRMLADGASPVPWTVIAAICAAFALVFCVLVVFCCVRRRKVVPSSDKPAGKGSEGKKQPGSLKSTRRTGSGKTSRAVEFSYDDILDMTDSWNPECVTEDAGHSSVWLGTQRASSQKYAIKRAKVIPSGNVHFMLEVQFLDALRHTNIVAFIGYCSANREQIRVFEFVPNGSLATWLRPLDDRAALNFKTRLNVAIGVADALKFLHSRSKPPIIHRDIKSETILLSRDFQAKLGGLGLYKHLRPDYQTYLMARRQGYLAPEWYAAPPPKPTHAVDVYSFGVVLLELITAKPAVIDEGEESLGGLPAHTTNLAQWAKPAISAGRIQDIMDQRMPMSEHTFGLVRELAAIALACLAHEKESRPKMAQVLGWLVDIKNKGL